MQHQSVEKWYSSREHSWSWLYRRVEQQVWLPYHWFWPIPDSDKPPRSWCIFHHRDNTTKQYWRFPLWVEARYQFWHYYSVRYKFNISSTRVIRTEFVPCGKSINYPENYFPHRRCDWNLQQPTLKNWTIISFEDFDLEARLSSSISKSLAIFGKPNKLKVKKTSALIS